MTLLKKIFEGYPEGFYEPSRFELFMHSSQFAQLHGVDQQVTEKEKEQATVYDIRPYGIQVRYEHQDPDSEEIRVFVSGETDKVQYIESIFLQESGMRGF